jgi:hypothetical protein
MMSFFYPRMEPPNRDRKEHGEILFSVLLNPCPSVSIRGFNCIVSAQGLARRKNRLPAGGVMVMLFVPLALVVTV